MGNLVLLPAAIHILFFSLESLLWGKPSTNKIFRLTPAEAATTKLLAFNQGFYNLFLAVAVVAGWYFKMGDVTYPMGQALIIYGLISMIGAGCVLFISSRKMWRGALLQILPSALGLWAVFATTLS